MASATNTTPRFEATPLSGSLGAEIRGADLTKADAADAEAILALIAEHLVLFFPDQHSTPDEHIAFGRLFGKLIRLALPDGLVLLRWLGASGVFAGVGFVCGLEGRRVEFGHCAGGHALFNLISRLATAPGAGSPRLGRVRKLREVQRDCIRWHRGHYPISPTGTGREQSVVPDLVGAWGWNQRSESFE